MSWRKVTTDSSPLAAPPTFATASYVSAERRAQSLSSKHQDFDALMSDLEADPGNHGYFDKADRWIADTFYGGNIESMRSIREKRNMSQTALARIVGTSQPQIARIESGRSDPQLSTILRLTEALSVDANTICAALGEMIVQKGWSAK